MFLATNVKVTADILEFEILTMIFSFSQTFPKHIMSVLMDLHKLFVECEVHRRPQTHSEF